MTLFWKCLGLKYLTKPSNELDGKIGEKQETQGSQAKLNSGASKNVCVSVCLALSFFL